MSPLLGIDYGKRRIGLAVSDATDTLASAVGVHREGRDGSIVERLRELIAERGITEVVVGWPVTVRGEEGEMAACARRFAARLRDELGLPVALLDERYSSQEAARYLQGSGRRRTGELDAVAAALILQVYLDRRRNRRDDAEAEQR